MISSSLIIAALCYAGAVVLGAVLGYIFCLHSVKAAFSATSDVFSDNPPGRKALRYCAARIGIALVVLLSTGCATISTHRYTVANNTGAIIDVYMNGERVGYGMRPGEVVTFRGGVYVTLHMLAVARDREGKILGTCQWRFRDQHINVWSVTHLERPGYPATASPESTQPYYGYDFRYR